MTAPSFQALLKKINFYYSDLSWENQESGLIANVSKPSIVVAALKTTLNELAEQLPPAQLIELKEYIKSISQTKTQVIIPSALNQLINLQQLERGFYLQNANIVVKNQLTQPLLHEFVSAGVEGRIDFSQYLNSLGNSLSQDKKQQLQVLMSQCQQSSNDNSDAVNDLTQQLCKALLGKELNLTIATLAKQLAKSDLSEEQLNNIIPQTNPQLSREILEKLAIALPLDAQYDKKVETANRVLTQALTDFMLINEDILSYIETDDFFSGVDGEKVVKNLHITAAVGSIVLSTLTMANRLRRDELSMKNLALNFLDNGSGLVSGGVGLGVNLSSIGSSAGFTMITVSKVITSIMKEASYQVKHSQQSAEVVESKAWLVEEMQRLQQEFDTIKEVWLNQLNVAINDDSLSASQKHQLLNLSKIQLKRITRQYQDEINSLRTATAGKAVELQATSSARRIKRVNNVTEIIIGIGGHFYPPAMLGYIATSGVEVGMQFFIEPLIEKSARANHGLRTGSIVLLGDAQQTQKAIEQLQHISTVTIAFAAKILKPGITSLTQQAKITDIVNQAKGQDTVALQLLHSSTASINNKDIKSIEKQIEKWEKNNQWLNQIINKMKETFDETGMPEIINLPMLQQQLLQQEKSLLKNLDNLAMTPGNENLQDKIDSLKKRLDNNDASNILRWKPQALSHSQQLNALLIKQNSLIRDIDNCFKLCRSLSYDQSISNADQVITELRKRHDSLKELYQSADKHFTDELAKCAAKIERLESVFNIFNHNVADIKTEASIQHSLLMLEQTYKLSATPGESSEQELQTYHNRITTLRNKIQQQKRMLCNKAANQSDLVQKKEKLHKAIDNVNSNINEIKRQLNTNRKERYSLMQQIEILKQESHNAHRNDNTLTTLQRQQYDLYQLSQKLNSKLEKLKVAKGELILELNNNTKDIALVQEKIHHLTNNLRFLLRNAPTGYDEEFYQLKDSLPQIERQLIELRLTEEKNTAQIKQTKAKYQRLSAEIKAIEQQQQIQQNTPGTAYGYAKEINSEHTKKLAQLRKQQQRCQEKLASLQEKNRIVELEKEFKAKKDEFKLKQKQRQQLKPLTVVVDRNPFGLTKQRQLTASVEKQVKTIKDSKKQAVSLTYYAVFTQDDIRDGLDSKLLSNKIEGLKTELQWVNALENKLRNTPISITNLSAAKDHYRQQLHYMRVAMRRHKGSHKELKFANRSNNPLVNAWRGLRRQLSSFIEKFSNFLFNNRVKEQYKKTETLFSQLPYQAHTISDSIASDAGQPLKAFGLIPHKQEVSILPSMHISTTDLIYQTSAESHRALIQTIVDELQWVKQVEEKSNTIVNKSELENYYQIQLTKLIAHGKLSNKEKLQLQKKLQTYVSYRFIEQMNNPIQIKKIKKTTRQIQQIKHAIISEKIKRSIIITDTDAPPNFYTNKNYSYSDTLRDFFTKLSKLHTDDPDLVRDVIKKLQPQLSDSEQDLLFECFEGTLIPTPADSSYKASRTLVTFKQASKKEKTFTLEDAERLDESLVQQLKQITNTPTGTAPANNDKLIDETHRPPMGLSH